MYAMGMTRLLLIGAAGLDWQGFHARLRSGGLPNMARVKSSGYAARLAGAPQGEGPAAWTSLVTGAPPDAHGVCFEQEAWAGGVRPTSRASWRAVPLWSRLAAAGVSTGSVGWPASRPGASWPGVHLDDSFAEPSGPDALDWALPLQCAPADVRTAIRSRRVHPADITGEMLVPLAPRLAAIDQTRDAGLPELAVSMAQTASIQGGAAWMLEARRPAAMFVHYPWLGRVRAAFDPPPDDLFADAVDGAWRFLDAMIGGLLARAGADTELVIVSPGWRGRAGLLLAAGPAIPLTAQTEGADILDVAPTALAVFGLEDPALPGRVLALPKASRAHAPCLDPHPPVETDPELMRSAVEKGYRPPSPPSPRWRADRLAALALAVLGRSPGVARDVAIAALQQAPDHLMALRVCAMARYVLEEADALPDLAAALERVAPERGWGGLALGAYHVLRGEVDLAGPPLVKAEADPDSETLLHVAAVWMAGSRPANAERVFRELQRREPHNAAAELGLSMTALSRRDFIAAEQAAHRALGFDPGWPSPYLQLAYVYARTARQEEAARAAAAAVRLGADKAAADAAREGRSAM